MYHVVANPLTSWTKGLYVQGKIIEVSNLPYLLLHVYYPFTLINGIYSQFEKLYGASWLETGASHLNLLSYKSCCQQYNWELFAWSRVANSVSQLLGGDPITSKAWTSSSNVVIVFFAWMKIFLNSFKCVVTDCPSWNFEYNGLLMRYTLVIVVLLAY